MICSTGLCVYGFAEILFVFSRPQLITMIQMKKVLFGLLMVVATTFSYADETHRETGAQERQLWVNTLVKVIDPVLTNLANETLRANMPQESLDTKRGHRFSHLEAFGRTLCGIAPWLELGADDTEEGKLREKYIKLTLKGLTNAVNPASPDYLDFKTPYQPLVDAAFLSLGILRAPTQVWGRLDKQAQKNLITELKRSRSIKPFQNNWLLFASIIEATLLELTGECDQERLLQGVRTFRDKWYVGDATYGDGPHYHADYYNSFVIHPLLTETLYVMEKHQIVGADFLPLQLKRFSRYAEQQERLISPEGAYPVIGRSIVYRTGAFHALSHAVLRHKLPSLVKPAQARCALTAVIKRQFSAPNTFDSKGWLRIGFVGSQIEMSESYINTGSVYLCTFGFVALGLPATDPFWNDGFTPWTSLKAWSGEMVKADHAL